VEPPIENEIYAAKADESNPLEIRTIADFDRILALNFVHPPRVPWVIKHGLVRRARGLADQHACIMRDLEPLLRDGLRGRLRTIDRPVLLIWGEADRIIDPSVVPLWEAELPDIEVLLLAHCGHVPWMDRPMETKAAICRFMGNEWA
jgi:pimeloyl-ACP methyl ester carboxylesterase